MALYLVQHGKSLSKDIDPDQGLSQEGIAETKRIAEVAANYRVNVSHIKHSVKARAHQTAEIFASTLNPAGGILEVAGLKPMDDVTTFAVAIDPDENIMLVGHLPFMERITSYLTTGSTENLVFKFQNGGILCLDENTHTKTWYIKWTLMPHIG